MLDIKRTSPEEIQRLCEDRGVNVDVPALMSAYSERLRLQRQVDDLRAASNEVSSNIGSATPEERTELIVQAAALKKQLREVQEVFGKRTAEFEELFGALPNLLASDTPIGHHEKDNVELEVHGKEPSFDFRAKNHIEIGNDLGLDFEAGTRIAGSGFPLLRGPLAQLEGAILRYTYDQAIQSGYVPVSVPLLARPEIMKGLGFNPRRSDNGTEIFFTAHDDLCLSGTAEIPLVGQFTGEILRTDSLPLKFVALTPCFRREGAHGRRDAGLYRNKMFHKVELVVLTTEDRSDATHEEIRAFETGIFKDLGIHFRVVRICSGDLGAPAFKKYDIEGWMMGRTGEKEDWGWGELTSCSNCTDYQARRLFIRHREGSQKPTFVHTLNGTGITTRALIPILEQHQNSDGSVTIPPVLRPYMGGREVLRKE